MARQWTKGERRKRIAARYYHPRKKLFMLFVLVFVFFALLGAISYTIRVGADPFLIGMLVVALLLMIPVIIFVYDWFYNESE